MAGDNLSGWTTGSVCRSVLVVLVAGCCCETTLINMLRRDAAAAVVPSYRSARRHHLPAFLAARYSWRQIHFCDSRPIHCDVMIVAQWEGGGWWVRCALFCIWDVLCFRSAGRLLHDAALKTVQLLGCCTNWNQPTFKDSARTAQ